jgi:hypothetical protein
MAGTLTIPLTRLSVGTTHFPATGGQPVADTDTLIVLTIDRTVSQGQTQGFNGQPATTTANILAEQSNDGGVTWQPLASAGFSGGITVIPRTGQTVTSNDVGVWLLPGTGRLARATVTIAGATVAVQGTLVIS